MNGEAFDDYVWMISEVDGILPRHPKVLVVDCDRGLIKAIRKNGQAQQSSFADFTLQIT